MLECFKNKYKSKMCFKCFLFMTFFSYSMINVLIYLLKFK